MSILVADIGGTNARFAIATAPPQPPALDYERKLPSRDFSSMEEAVAAYMERVPEAQNCRWTCLGLPGPVREERCDVTNLPWVVDGPRLAVELGFESALLVNDLEAAAFGLEVLEPDDLLVLAEGDREEGGNRALLAPGTGHGQAGLFWDGERYHPFATEGGHADFGPTDELEVELWRYLTGLYGRVSWERVVSGAGLIDLFRFFVERHGKEVPDWFESGVADGTAPKTITKRARDGSCGVCVETIELFLALLGAEAGNLGLKLKATGGVYVAGGIIPKLIPELERSRFMSRFRAKGRMRRLVESIPVSVVLDVRLALWGAAARMRRELSTGPGIEPTVGADDLERGELPRQRSSAG